MSSAPIALVIYNRAEHTLRTIGALKANPEFATSSVFVFCDGPKSEQAAAAVYQARAAARSALPGATFVESEHNKGLAKSVYGAVSRLTEQYGRAILLEDDLLLAPDTLSFLNAALDRYADDSKVMQVSAYLPRLRDAPDAWAHLLPFTTSWGWATWRRAWKDFDLASRESEKILADTKLARDFDLGGRCRYSKMLRTQLTGKSDSWAILWYAHMFLRQGLAIFPPSSRVQNVGFDGSGTHGSWRADPALKEIGHPPLSLQSPVRFPERIAIDEEFLEKVSAAMGRSVSLLNIATNLARAGLARIAGK